MLGYVAGGFHTTLKRQSQIQLEYRIKATHGLRVRLGNFAGQPDLVSHEEFQAFIASFHVLAAQSTILDEGLPQYMTCMQGIGVAMSHFMCWDVVSNLRTMFEWMRSDIYTTYLRDVSRQ